MPDEATGGDRASCRVRLPVLGVTTTFSTDTEDARDAVVEAYGSWSELPRAVVTDSPCVVRILSDDGLPARVPARGHPSLPRYRVPNSDQMLVLAEGGLGLADTSRHESIAFVDRSLLSDRERFHDQVLDPLTLFLLGGLDRRPLHAAAVVRGGAAVLLTGPSGAGKSTLAYAARRAGFATLADEPVYLQMEPRLRVWGRRDRLHLPVEARRHFPELRDAVARPLPNGKRKIVVQGSERPSRYAERAGICLLRRDPAADPALEPLAVSAVVDELTRSLDPGYDLFADGLGDSIARVAEAGAWALHWSGEPEEALPLLDRAATELSRS